MSVTIGKSVKSIGGYAFCDCYKLVEVINHSSLNINKGSHSYGDVGYCALIVHGGETSVIDNAGDFQFITSGDNKYLLGYLGTENSIELPSSYLGGGYKIYFYAFAHFYNLTSVTIPDGVTSIGGSAFERCTNLTSVTIGSDVTSIDNMAFEHCTSLTSIIIPDSVTSIGWRAFYNCKSLTRVKSPETVTEIGEIAFEGCPATISSAPGSAAEQYAKENNIPFKAV